MLWRERVLWQHRQTDSRSWQTLHAVVVELYGPIFGETKSIHKVNLPELIRIANQNALAQTH